MWFWSPSLWRSCWIVLSSSSLWAGVLLQPGSLSQSYLCKNVIIFSLVLGVKWITMLHVCAICVSKHDQTNPFVNKSPPFTQFGIQGWRFLHPSLKTLKNSLSLSYPDEGQSIWPITAKIINKMLNCFSLFCLINFRQYPLLQIRVRIFNTHVRVWPSPLWEELSWKWAKILWWDRPHPLMFQHH